MRRTADPSQSIARDSYSTLHRLKLARLLAFVVVAEESSFSLAAERMHVSQSAVSVQVRQLEDFLGVPLFHRTTRNVRLTSAGEELYVAVSGMFTDLVRVTTFLKAQAQLQCGVVTVAALPLYARALIPRVMREFQAVHPKLEVRLLDVNPDTAIELVRRGTADFALLDESDGLDELEFCPLFVEDFVLIAARENRLLVRRRALSISDAARDYPFVLLRSGIHARTIVDSMFAAAGATPRITQECEKPETLLALVANGFGLTVLPRSILAAANFSRLRVFDVTELAGRAVGIVRRRDRAEAPAVTSFRKYLEAQVAEYPLRHNPGSRRPFPRNAAPTKSV